MRTKYKSVTKNTMTFISFAFPVTILIAVVWELIYPGVGANIGAGLLVGLGLVLTLIGLISLISVGSSRVRKIAAVVLIALLVVVPVVWRSLENQANQKFCNEKVSSTDTMPKEDIGICKKYYPNIN